MVVKFCSRYELIRSLQSKFYRLRDNAVDLYK